MSNNPFVGSWTYRSLLNDPDLATPFDKLEFGRATIVIEEADFQLLKGTIGGDDWSLALHGSRAYGSPMQARFQGKGLVNGEQWVYDYIAWLVPDWPNSNATLQRAAMVGSVVRTVPHSSSNDKPDPCSSSDDKTDPPDPPKEKPIAPAGVVASFYAVRQD